MTNTRDDQTYGMGEQKSQTESDAASKPEQPPDPLVTATAADAASTATLASIGVESTPPATTIPAPPLAAVAAVGELVGGKYELLRLIAEGGMGKVFLARHRELSVRVAVKIMHDHIARNLEHVERFRREALAASRLTHPNIVRVLDFGRFRETFYIVMEYVEGQSLGDWLETRVQVPPLSEIQPILVQILDALIEAHAAGIVHRDLKPDNVLLTHDARGFIWVRLVDFGLAHFHDLSVGAATITHVDAVAGTPAYMSPEQCRSLKVTQSTDLYAFGCILTELLQLGPVFTGDSTMEVISKHMFAPVPALQRPADVEAISPLLDRLRCELLAKTPSRRPVDASVVRSRLLHALQSGPQEQEATRRKSPLAGGSREERTPEWNNEAITSPVLVPSTSQTIEYRLLSDAERAVDALCLVGLSALGFDVREVPATSGIEEDNIALVDAGGNSSLATSSLRGLRAAFPRAVLVVCLNAVTPSIIGSLIEAGADDVVRGPATADVLRRKLSRLRRSYSVKQA